MEVEIDLRHVPQEVSIVPCFKTGSDSILLLNHKASFIRKDRLDQCIMTFSAQPADLTAVESHNSHGERRKPDP